MLLDTTFLIDLQRELGGGRARGAIRFLREHPEARPVVSLVTWMEFAEGYEVERGEACRSFLSRFPVVAPDQEIAWQAARIQRQLRERGSPIGDHDAWIAATALVRGIPVVTRDVGVYGRVAGLEVVGY